jgi:hypothetical protein
MDRWKLQQMQQAQQSGSSMTAAANMPVNYKMGFCKAACIQLGISATQAERLFKEAH